MDFEIEFINKTTEFQKNKVGLEDFKDIKKMKELGYKKIY